MIRTRFNPDASPASAQLNEIKTDLPPSAWIAQASNDLSSAENAAFVVLLGATDLVGFRLRVAQSSFRSDALPGFFSHAALAIRRARKLSLFHVPLTSATPGSVPARNGIEPLELANLDSVPGLYANLALLHIPVADPTVMETAVQNLGRARLSDDLVSPIPAWLAYAWLTNGSTNPLLEGQGIPSAMFVESCFTACDIDIVAGISQRIVCPEAIWQAARFWSKSLPQATGRYELRQEQAAATVE
jgi:hypothetical protein